MSTAKSKKKAAKDLASGVSKTLVTVELKDIIKDNYRQEIDKERLKSLSENIKENGILQPPGVYYMEDGSIGLIYGKRRTLAAEMAGLTTIEAYLYEGITEAQIEELSIIENVQREQPSDYDTYVAVKKLTNSGMKMKEIASKLGISKYMVQKMSSLMSVPQDLMEMMKSGKLKMDVLLYIGSLEPELMKAIQEYIVNAGEDAEDLTVDDIQSEFVNEESLDRAPFDIRDASLYKKAGACTSCIFGTIHNVLLAEQYSGRRICTNMACYSTKEKAAERKQLLENPFGCRTIMRSKSENPIYLAQLEQLIGFGFTVIDEKMESTLRLDPEFTTDENIVDGYDPERDSDQFRGFEHMIRREVNPNDNEAIEAAIDENLSDPLFIEGLYRKVCEFVLNNKHLIYFDTTFMDAFEGKFVVPTLEVEPITEWLTSVGLNPVDVLSVDNDEDEEEINSDEYHDEDDEEDASVAPKAPKVTYTDSVQAGKLIEKIKRSNDLPKEKIVEFMSKQALDELSGTMNLSDPEAMDVLNLDEEGQDKHDLALMMAMIQNGRAAKMVELYNNCNPDDQVDRYSNKYAHRLAIIALGNPLVRRKIELSFIYQYAFDNVYVNPQKQDPVLEAICNYPKAKDVLTSFIAGTHASYEAKRKKYEEKLEALVVKEEVSA
jgi:ParB/RepB/Spo0J family partition protein